MSARTGSGATHPARRLPIRWSLVLATLAVLAAIVALRRAEPDIDRKLAPIDVPARVGTRAVARNFSVLVKRVKLAHAYRVVPKLSWESPKQVVPDGIWMSALVEAEASAHEGAIGARLRTRDGLYYVASPSTRPDIGGVNLSGRHLVTGLPATGGYFFDVDPKRLEGAHLEFFWGGQRQPSARDHVIDVDLGLDAAAVRRMVDEASPMLELK